MANDSLSALYDGECTGPELDRLLEELERSPEMGSQWSRLCASRESVEGTRIAAGQPCICAGVMAAIAAEPAQANDKVIDLAVRRAGRSRRLAGLWKPAVGFAAAASMGAAAVLLVRPGEDGREIVQASNGGAFERTGSYERAGNDNLRKVILTDHDAYSETMREYMIEHSNSVDGVGGTGALWYTRLAAHHGEYQALPAQEESRR